MPEREREREREIEKERERVLLVTVAYSPPNVRRNFLKIQSTAAACIAA